MAVVVTFFDQAGCEITKVAGKGDPIIARLFSEFLVDELKARGWIIRAEIKSDETNGERNLPNLRETTEEFARILTARTVPMKES